jgi:hypothetical protein
MFNIRVRATGRATIIPDGGRSIVKMPLPPVDTARSIGRAAVKAYNIVGAHPSWIGGKTNDGHRWKKPGVGFTDHKAKAG